MKRGTAAQAWAIWAIAALVGAGLWWRHERNLGSIPAVATAARHRLGAIEPSRVLTVYVNPGDAVTTGQALLQFDCSEVDRELGVARGRLEEQLATVEAVTMELTTTTRQRRIDTETELAQARAALASAKGLHEAQQAELEELNQQMARLDKVIRDRLAEIDKLSMLRARQGRLVSRARYAPETLAAWSALAEQMRAVLEDLAGDDVAVRLRPVQARVETHNQRIHQLLERQSRCTMRSPVDGQVSEIIHVSGDAIPAGTTVAVVVSPVVTRVTAYVPEDRLAALIPGGAVEIYPTDRSAHASHGVVAQVGPEIIELPPRLWLAPEHPRYGRPVHIDVESGADLFPGELASVRGSNNSVQAAPVPGSDSFAAQIPETLKQRSRLELSGLVWVPARQRFLAVSDDTGWEQRDEHHPWVFWLGADGKLDPEPVSVLGVDRLSDLESITRAPNGTIYLLASQSLSKKGKRPTKRQWLLRTELGDAGLTVTGKVALYDQVLARLDVTRRAALGITDQLDIEGMAWHAGGLLLGLKAPQDSAGRALMWQLADIDPLLDSPSPSNIAGAVDHEVKLSLFHALALPTCLSGAAGGISELFLEGTHLYLLSTLPVGAACGSAWRIELPLGSGAPVKLADWNDLRPEGLARAGEGPLIVSFDTGAAIPRLTQLVERPAAAPES